MSARRQQLLVSAIACGTILVLVAAFAGGVVMAVVQ